MFGEHVGFEVHALADAAERYLAQGFAALKIRFHRGDWRADIRALETDIVRMLGEITGSGAEGTL